MQACILTFILTTHTSGAVKDSFFEFGLLERAAAFISGSSTASQKAAASAEIRRAAEKEQIGLLRENTRKMRQNVHDMIVEGIHITDYAVTLLRY